MISAETVLPRLIRLVAYSGGACLVLWALWGARFRHADGALRGEFCLPVAAGVALALVGYALARRTRTSACWLALALVGQAIALQMIEAGPHIRYQHYKTLDRLITWPSSLLLIFLIIQSVVVLFGLKARWSQIRGWLWGNFKVWQIVVIALVFLLPSAAVSRDVKLFLVELPFAAVIQVINLANVALIALALPHESLVWLKQKIEWSIGSANESAAIPARRIDGFVLAAAMWVTLLSGLLSFFSYGRHPHIPDEVVYIYHARYLAAGMLTMPLPPAPDAFNIDLMNYEADRWYCPVPPGWPAMLAVGVLFGVPWLVNPVLAGLNVLLAYLLVRELYSRRVARMVVLLLCVSPWHVFMAMNFMTHTFTMTCALAAALALVWARKTGKVWWAWGGGMATGMVSLIRPLEGFVLAGLLGLWSIGIGGRRLKVPAIAAFVLGTITTGALVLPYNKLLTGSPTVFPIMAYTDKYYGPNKNALGFGPDRGLGWQLDPFPGHGLPDVLVNSELNTFSMNVELLGWGAGSFLLIACLLFSGRRFSGLRRSDYLMLSAITAIFVAHIFYWYSGGPDFGARYWYLMLIPCLALTVRGIESLQNKIEVGGNTISSIKVTAAVVSLCFLALVNYFPWRAIDKYHNYLEMRPDVRLLADKYHFGRSLVLIRGDRHPDYASAAVYNPLDFRADVPVYAWDKSPDVRMQALEAYPDRPVWILNGPSITHGGFEIVEGPLPAHELMAKQRDK